MQALIPCGLTAMEASGSHFEKTEGISKSCPRCGSTFVCKVEDIRHCQCASVKLTEKVAEFIQLTYMGCLCINCLYSIKQEINPFD